jgi:hypothetical protein
MSLSPSVRRRLLPIAGLAAPVLALQVAQSLLAVGPSSAAGSSPRNYVPPSAVPVPPAAKAPAPLTPDQSRALEWLRAAGKGAAVRSPMEAAAPRTPEPVVERTPEPIVETPPTVAVKEPLPVPRVSLTTILNRPDDAGGAIAAINSKIYRVGDQVAPGWTLTAIDRDQWTVTLTCEDGRTITVGSTRLR